MRLAEHQQEEKDIPATQRKIQKMGYKSWWTQANATDKGGTSGGTSIHLHKCYQAWRLDWAALPSKRHLPGNPNNWTGIIVKAYTNFAAVTAYFKHGIGMVGENVVRLMEILGWLKGTGLPWLIIADWNVTPKELLDSGYLQTMKGHVVTPEGMAATCSAGSGRMLDYAAASPEMTRIIKVTACKDAPTKPHIGIEISIDMEMLDDPIRVVQAPPIPVMPAIRKIQHRHNMEIKEDPHMVARRRKLPKKGAWKQQVALRHDEDVESSEDKLEVAKENAKGNKALTWDEAAGLAASKTFSAGN